MVDLVAENFRLFEILDPYLLFVVNGTCHEVNGTFANLDSAAHYSFRTLCYSEKKDDDFKSACVCGSAPEVRRVLRNICANRLNLIVIIRA